MNYANVETLTEANVKELQGKNGNNVLEYESVNSTPITHENIDVFENTIAKCLEYRKHGKKLDDKLPYVQALKSSQYSLYQIVNDDLFNYEIDSKRISMLLHHHRERLQTNLGISTKEKDSQVQHELLQLCSLSKSK